MENIKFKRETKRYGCAVLAAVIFAVNIKTFVRAGGLYPGGFNGLTLLLQSIFDQFMGIEVPYTLINILLNAIPISIGLKFIGRKFTLSACCVIVLSSILTDIIPVQPITYDTLLISIFGGLINGLAASLCLIGNTCSGGTDFIAIYFSEKAIGISGITFCAEMPSCWLRPDSCSAGTRLCIPSSSSLPPHRWYRCCTRDIKTYAVYYYPEAG